MKVIYEKNEEYQNLSENKKIKNQKEEYCMKVTYEKAYEEYQNLSENEKKVYNKLLSSPHINHLIEGGCYDDVDVIINFKLLKEKNRDYFEFDIAAPLESASKSYLIYHIKGSIFKNQNIESILYTVKSVKDNTLYGIYIDNKNIIKENIFLNETFKIKNSSKRIIKVVLTIYEDLNKKETFTIDPKSPFYRLYSKGKIDLGAFCNYVLFQSKENKNTQLTRKIRKN